MENRTEKARNNFFAMTCHLIVVVILTIAYAIETFVKQEREVTYLLIMAAIGFIPVIMEQIFYRKNSETNAVKHLFGVGYSILYMYLLFTANNPLTFTYAILMVIVLCVFNDNAFSIRVNVAVVIMNVVQIIIGYNTNSLGYTNLASAEIQIILLILLAGFSIVLTNVLRKNNMQKLATIKEQQEQAESRYNQTIEIVEKMTADIKNIYSRVHEISSTANFTRNAMEEVSRGSANTSEAVQNQLLQTKSIQDNLSDADEAANTLLNEMNSSKTEIETGRVNMSNMVERVNKSVEIGNEVTSQLEVLDEKINEMHSIVGIINGITSQTALLSLNASIEAARAGEAGKGFAVVASEISNMATQTKSATIHITDLIQNVSEAITKVVDAIRVIIEGINLEKEITTSTEQSFIQIADSSDIMSKSISKVTQIVAELVKSNVDIIDAIQTISGVSEEVSAHATETFDAEEDNVTRLQEITELMEDLKELTSKL